MNTISFMQELPLFKDVEEEHLQELARIVREKKISRGSIIFFENDPGETLYIIKKGVIKIYISSPLDGREKTLSFLQKGDYFGEMALIDGFGRSAAAEVLEDAELLLIYKEDFLNLLNKNPHIAYRIIYTLIQRLREANEQIEELVFRDARHRIGKVLLRLANKYAKNQPRSSNISIYLTHEELANFAGTSRETASRVINELEEKKILRTKRHNIVVDITGIRNLLRNSQGDTTPFAPNKI